VENLFGVQSGAIFQRPAVRPQRAECGFRDVAAKQDAEGSKLAFSSADLPS
jgi:hypothetical protein